MLADYGKMVKKLDADLVKEREDQTSTLEQKLRDRKQKRLREIEVARKEKEVLLNAETVKTTSKLNTEMKQIESLLDPIKDEEDRMAMILAQSNQESALVDNDGQTPGRAAEMQITLSDEAKQAQEQLS
jgi:transcriptional regulator with PAS, ATPase and Fis domain